MGKDYSALPYNHVRRQDRQVEDDSWIKGMLHRSPLAVLSTLFGGQPFINSNIFVYDEEQHLIYMHTARDGRTRSNVERDERVCFSVCEMGRLLPAKTAKEMSVEYSGVVIFGTAAIVVDQAEAQHGLKLLLDKYFPHLTYGEDYRSITTEELEQTTVYRIRIEQWSGKKKEAPADFPGAFFYGKVPPPAQSDPAAA